MTNKVITISRQFGSGGRTIGKKVAEKLGIPYYDKELPGNFGALVKLLAQIDNQILLLLRHKVLPFQSKKAGRRCFRLPAMSVCSYVFLRCTAGC